MNNIKYKRQLEIKEKYKLIKSNRIKNGKRLKYNKRKSNELKYNQRNKKNIYEIVFKDILKEYNIKYIWQQPFFDAKRYVCVDFFIPDKNIVIEIDGFFHFKKENKKYDKKRTEYLLKTHNIKEVIRITNNQLIYKKNKIIDTILDKLD